MTSAQTERQDLQADAGGWPQSYCEPRRASEIPESVYDIIYIQRDLKYGGWELVGMKTLDTNKMHGDNAVRIMRLCRNNPNVSDAKALMDYCEMAYNCKPRPAMVRDGWVRYW